MYENNINTGSGTIWTTSSSSTGDTDDWIKIDGTNISASNIWTTVDNTISLDPLWGANVVGHLIIEDGFLSIQVDGGERINLVDIKTGKEVNSLMNVVAKKMLEK